MTQQLTHEEARRQAKVIVDQMTIDEKIGQIKYEAPAIDRLNIPEYNYWNEALHGVARAGVATVFPQAIGLAATFDDHLINEIADVIGTEGRAKYNEFTKHEDRDIYKGLTFWSPNVNIFRDPRWGRGHETYGEDPFLTSKFGVAFIKGLQGQAKYLKLAATAKHFAVHSGPEGLRHGFDAVDGVPASVSEMLLKEILHDKWSFEGHVVSDYMAPEDVHENHKYTKDAAETMGLAIKAGLNLVAGHIEQSLHEALDRGLVTEEEITNAVISLYATRVRLGMFATDNEYDAIPYEANDTKAHNNLSEIAAEKSFVLLKNDGVLPLHKETMEAIAVVGPNAHSEIALLGNYFGTPSRSYTILEGIQERLGDDVRVHYSIGSGLFQDHAAEPLAKADERESEAVIAAEHSDVVVAVLGLDSTIEGEEGDAGNSQGAGDKPNLSLPGRQRQLLERLLAVGKPVVVLLASGSSLQLDGLENHPNLRAIMQIWYPGARGGLAVADVLFGAVSPSGKLPVTFYKNVDNLPAFEDYNMAGRTYRYMTDEALYPFGYGLTYSSVELSDLQVKSYEDTATVTATIQNTGNFDTDEVVQVYVKDLGSEFAVPNAQLKGFKRVYLGKGAKQTITFDLRPQDFEVFDAQGRNFIDSDRFEISVGVSQPDSRSVALTGVQPLQTELSLAGSQTMH